MGEEETLTRARLEFLKLEYSHLQAHLAACRSKPGEASLNPGVEALAGEIVRFWLKPPLQNVS